MASYIQVFYIFPGKREGRSERHISVGRYSYLYPLKVPSVLSSFILARAVTEAAGLLLST